MNSQSTKNEREEPAELMATMVILYILPNWSPSLDVIVTETRPSLVVCDVLNTLEVLVTSTNIRTYSCTPNSTHGEGACKSHDTQ